MTQDELSERFVALANAPDDVRAHHAEHAEEARVCTRPIRGSRRITRSGGGAGGVRGRGESGELHAEFG